VLPDVPTKKPAIALALLAAACGHAGPAAVSAQSVPPAVEAVLPALRADAARRSGRPEASLAVQHVESVTWPDGALGCPEPGRLYPQVLVPGWRVRIGAAGLPPLQYHLSARGGWLHCPLERATPPLPRSADPRV
jgi:hypothetical protein